MIITTCNAEQILAAACDVEPICFGRYPIDQPNESLDIQQAAEDRAYWFLVSNSIDQQMYSGNMATKICSGQLAFAWSIFPTDEGVAAHTTYVCTRYPPDDVSPWDLRLTP